jgi:RNA polymerase sigma factor (sigma-70 family)
MNCHSIGMMRKDSFATAYQNGFHATIRLMLSKGLLIDEAEELAQAAWVRGWEARQQLKRDDRVVQWVNSIAISTMHNEKRRSRRYEELDESRTHHAPPPPVAAKIDLDKLLKQCSSLDRSLIQHRYMGGFEMEEVARLHGLTCVAARVRLHRVRAALRRYAEPQTQEMTQVNG